VIFDVQSVRPASLRSVAAERLLSIRAARSEAEAELPPDTMTEAVESSEGSENMPRQPRRPKATQTTRIAMRWLMVFIPGECSRSF